MAVAPGFSCPLLARAITKLSRNLNPPMHDIEEIVIYTPPRCPTAPNQSTRKFDSTQLTLQTIRPSANLNHSKESITQDGLPGDNLSHMLMFDCDGR